MTSYLGLGFVAWAPLAQGRLTGKYRPGSTEARRLSAKEAGMSEAKHAAVAATLAVAGELDAPATAVALRWMMQHQPQIIPIIGARTVQQLEQSMGSLAIELSDSQLERLNAASAIDAGSPTSFMRSEPGRDFMWGRQRTVPSTTASPTRPWWEL